MFPTVDNEELLARRAHLLCEQHVKPRRCEMAGEIPPSCRKIAAHCQPLRLVGLLHPRRRTGEWKGLVLVVLACLPFASMQQCSSDYISWPREQCTEDCPKMNDVEKPSRCRYDTIIYTSKQDHCCLCVSDQDGVYTPKLCPGSLKNRPPAKQVCSHHDVS